jgi:uncharacterized membrane protein YkgB
MVERSLSMREVRGSIPRISISVVFILFYLVKLVKSLVDSQPHATANRWYSF